MAYMDNVSDKTLPHKALLTQFLSAGASMVLGIQMERLGCGLRSSDRQVTISVFKRPAETENDVKRQCSKECWDEDAESLMALHYKA